MFDLSINLGNVLTILSFIIGGLFFISNVKSDVRVLDMRLTAVDAQLEDFKIQQAKVNDILIAMATATGRANAMEERILAQGRRLDEIITRVNVHLDFQRLNQGDE